MESNISQDETKTGWWNKRRVVALIIVIIMILFILMAGTFAWFSISQNALNEARGVVVGGRLHDDFDGKNKDIYVENYSTSDSIFVRVKLYEYMEIGKGAGLRTGDKGFNEKNVSSSPGIINDYTTWSVHVPGVLVSDCGLGPDILFHDYWTWTMGGQKVFMPTFNKDNTDLRSDISGNINWGFGSQDYEHKVSGGVEIGGNDGINSGYPGAHDQYNGVTSITDIAYYKDNRNVEEIHKAMNTLSTGVPITMQDWINGGQQLGNFWVMDTDGWCYWAAPLLATDATGLLLNEIKLDTAIADEWYYAIYADMQCFNRHQYNEFLGKIGSDYTTDGKDLLDIITYLPPSECCCS